LLSSRLSLREIGNELYVSVNTIKTHTRNVYAKLRVSSRQQAVARARELGLLRRSRPVRQ
ncbi:MAG TPA: LuxR C-terminal-related transcriptional regulator, partial [Streptosporangiaceae bacterium]|nr:LuxR C-terminal-related transcriptional regulator [Streptosporangiaceae bacterium]